MIIYSYVPYIFIFELLLGEISTPRPRGFTAGPLPDNRNPRFHALSDTCFSDLLPPILHLLLLSPYHSASVSRRQLGNLNSTFETIADLESIDDEANKTGRYLRMLHTQILYPFVLVIDPAWIWTTALSQATSNILSVSCTGRG